MEKSNKNKFSKENLQLLKKKYLDGFIVKSFNYEYKAFYVLGEEMCCTEGTSFCTPSESLILAKELKFNEWNDSFKYGCVILIDGLFYFIDVKIDVYNHQLLISTRDFKKESFYLDFNDIDLLFRVVQRSF